MNKLSDLSPNKWFVLNSRYLTVGERELAQQIFGRHLRLDGIKVIAHRLILRHYGMSPNGHIYFHAQDWCEDFSTQSIELQSWLIHELTHVWQVQTGVFALKKAIFDRRYQYVLKLGKKFVEYGIEQQAQMVQDYFLKMKKGEECKDLAQCLPFLPSSF